ncbi:hypothetical protein T190_07110 [Sinorhizobium meliloti CCBAU 01290]|nr:hypothetical protein T190_07110 [Sinorhizobium meliloti CCBAU 01290]
MRQSDAAFPRHHHVDDQKIEIDAYQLSPGLVGIGCRRYAKSLFDQIAVEQVADAPVIVDDQKMRRTSETVALLSSFGTLIAGQAGKAAPKMPETVQHMRRGHPFSFKGLPVLPRTTSRRPIRRAQVA